MSRAAPILVALIAVLGLQGIVLMQAWEQHARGVENITCIISIMDTGTRQRDRIDFAYNEKLIGPAIPCESSFPHPDKCDWRASMIPGFDGCGRK